MAEDKSLLETMVEDESVPKSKKDVFAMMLCMRHLEQEAELLLRGRLGFKQPVVSVYLFHDKRSKPSLAFLPHFNEMVLEGMQLYGFKVRYLQAMVFEGCLKKAVSHFGITSFPTVLVRRKDGYIARTDLLELNEALSLAPKDDIHGFDIFMKKVKEDIEEGVNAAE